MAEKILDGRIIDLGFLEECSSWKLESRFFPSKVGGMPSWLNLMNLPDNILCGVCQKPCVFLCQIYAPIEDMDTCFHRTLFVFMCKNPQCSCVNDSKNFRIFRCQLGRKNSFYSFEPPITEESWLSDVVPEMCKTCFVCGARAPTHCGKCKAVYYCGKEHQIIDWKSNHKRICSTGGVVLEDASINTGHGVLLPQFEVMIEPEDCLLEKENTDDCKTEKDRLEDFKKMVEDGKAGTLQEDASVDEDLQKISSTEDKQFLKFSSKIKRSPDQVLRYEKGGEPLWISSNHIPKEEDIPCCEYCGESRIFEFQILPQMLSYLGLDNVGKSVDWGILAIYTCSKSCDGNPAYKEEFLWKQDITSS